jgi:hypothetical protein
MQRYDQRHIILTFEPHNMVSCTYRLELYQIVRGRQGAVKIFDFKFIFENTNVLLQKSVRGRFKFENCPRPL